MLRTDIFYLNCFAQRVRSFHTPCSWKHENKYSTSCQIVLLVRL